MGGEGVLGFYCCFRVCFGFVAVVVVVLFLDLKGVFLFGWLVGWLFSCVFSFFVCLFFRS